MMNFKEIMKQINFEILQGANWRFLAPSPSVTRAEFLAKCESFIANTEASFTDLEERRLAKMGAIKALAEQSFFFFAVFVLGLDFANTDYCYRLANDIQTQKWNKIWIIAREHFKTTFITQASSLWELLGDQNRTTLIVSYKDTKAQEIMGQIKQWCENCQLLPELWPDIFYKNPAKGYDYLEDGTKITWTWNSTSICVKQTTQQKQNTFEIGGIEGSAKTGGHFGYIIFDDAETPKTVQTKDSMEKAYATIINYFNVGQISNSNTCFIGTFYARDDIYTRLIKKGIMENGAVIQPCCEKDGTPICYSAEDLENRIKKLRETGNEFTQMFCDPSVNLNISFDKNWLVMHDEIDLKGKNVYMIVDPSGYKQLSTGDNTSILIVGIDTFGSIWVKEMPADKMSQEMKFTIIISLFQRYRPTQIFYEEVSMQADIPYLQHRANTELHAHLPITPFNMKRYGSKENKILRLRGAMMEGKIHIPTEYIMTDYQGSLIDVVRYFVQEELLAFPTGEHDDILDNLANTYLLLIEDKLIKPEIQINNRFGIVDNRYNTVLGQSDFEIITDGYDCLGSYR